MFGIIGGLGLVTMGKALKFFL